MKPNCTKKLPSAFWKGLAHAMFFSMFLANVSNMESKVVNDRKSPVLNPPLITWTSLEEENIYNSFLTTDSKTYTLFFFILKRLSFWLKLNFLNIVTISTSNAVL